MAPTPSQGALEGIKVLAIVGDQHVLRGELIHRVQIVMQPILEKMTPEDR